MAQLVRETIQMRPSLLDALNMKIVNYSALARLLQDEMGEGSLEAVKAAVIRVADEISQDRGLREEAVLGILKESKVRLQDKIAGLGIGRHSQDSVAIPAMKDDFRSAF